VPTLAQMTEKAIGLLSSNEKGFFLQVEAPPSINRIMRRIRAVRLAKPSTLMKRYKKRWSLPKRG
jgi:hypothetical protein